jgi:hypothetical protein
MFVIADIRLIIGVEASDIGLDGSESDNRTMLEF